jgi:LmbE family N-acetylglucosaminyl deacetylase
MATITFFHAHPDDEAIATGGTMVSLAGQGHRVVLVTATRGELGETPDGLLGPGESLTERRMSELAEACRLLGVARQTFLDYHDSGMAGEPTNDDPGSFAAADVTEAAAALAAVLDDEASDVLVIYDEHGGYGHPDHVQVHRVGMRAAELAATPVVYMATMNRDVLRSFVALAESSDWDPVEGTPDGMETMGEPASRLTTEVDVTPWIETKRQAMRVHASQIGETSLFLSMPEDVFSMVFGQEWYIRVKPEVDGSPAGTRETGFMMGAGSVSEDGGAATVGGRAQP